MSRPLDGWIWRRADRIALAQVRAHSEVLRAEIDAIRAGLRDHVFVTLHCPECLCKSHAEPCTTALVDRDGRPALCNCTSAGR